MEYRFASRATRSLPSVVLLSLWSYQVTPIAKRSRGFDGGVCVAVDMVEFYPSRFVAFDTAVKIQSEPLASKSSVSSRRSWHARTEYTSRLFHKSHLQGKKQRNICEETTTGCGFDITQTVSAVKSSYCNNMINRNTGYRKLSKTVGYCGKAANRNKSALASPTTHRSQSGPP